MHSLKPGWSRFELWMWLILVLAFLTCGPDGMAAEVAGGRFEIPATDGGLPGAGPIRRYDWFKQLWAERRAAWAERLEKDRGAVVFLGDSITQGWGDDFSRRFPGVRIANRGISGDTTRGVLIRLKEDVLDLRPAGIVLLIGTNDLEEGATPDVIVANLKLILVELQRHNPDMPVVLCQVFPSSETKKRAAGSIKRINQSYAEAIRGSRQVTILETWALFANEKGDAKVEEFPDLLHPNESGYAKWAKALVQTMESRGMMKPEAEAFEVEPGYVSLFNGKDLTGWGLRRTSEQDKEGARRWKAADPQAPDWPIVVDPISFEGKSSSVDGRFAALNGRLTVTVPPEGRKIQQLYTTRDFPSDFILKLEFRAAPNADSGVFLRGVQLQCRDYPLAGPYKHLKAFRAQDWNEMVVEVKGNVARCTCNGEVLEEALRLPATGPVGVEGDRGLVEYRRLRLKTLP